MTQQEYEQICKMIDNSQTLVCRSVFDSEWIITNRGVQTLKNEIKKLIKGAKHDGTRN